jgi:hypothetical protein
MGSVKLYIYNCIAFLFWVNINALLDLEQYDE